MNRSMALARRWRAFGVLLVLTLGCGASAPTDTSTLGPDSAATEAPVATAAGSNTDPPTHAVWTLQTRVRTTANAPWQDLEAHLERSPLGSAVVVSGGVPIGELGRVIGCDESVQGARMGIRCVDLGSRHAAELTVRCPVEGAVLRFDRAPAESLEIRVGCQLGTLE